MRLIKNISIFLLTVLLVSILSISIFASESTQQSSSSRDKIKQEIKETGKAAVYGIYFDTNKSVVKPESEAAISDIAAVLKDDPTLKIYLVGHTDITGEFDYNMKLSKARAEAVVRVLVYKYGISSYRLKAYGVGPLAPVDTNKTEEGRAKNRRVELVQL